MWPSLVVWNHGDMNESTNACKKEKNHASWEINILPECITRSQMVARLGRKANMSTRKDRDPANNYYNPISMNYKGDGSYKENWITLNLVTWKGSTKLLPFVMPMIQTSHTCNRTSAKIHHDITLTCMRTIITRLTHI